MARPRRPEQKIAARSSRDDVRRFLQLINTDDVFHSHLGGTASSLRADMIFGRDTDPAAHRAAPVLVTNGVQCRSNADGKARKTKPAISLSAFKFIECRGRMIANAKRANASDEYVAVTSIPD